MSTASHTRVLALVVLALLGSGCTPLGLAVGAGATAGVGASQERGLSGSASDTAIRARINELWFRENVEALDRVGLSISEGRVLLTGAVPEEKVRADAVRLAWRVPQVREVINEIKVDAGRGGADFGRDTLITTRLRAAITFDGSIQSINYAIDTVDATVYLMGVGQDRAEIDRVINHARNIPYVRGVVSHVLTRDDPRRGAGRPASQP